MTSDEVIRRVREAPNRAELARLTRLPYNYLCRIAAERIKNPGTRQIDALREYFLRDDGRSPL